MRTKGGRRLPVFFLSVPRDGGREQSARRDGAGASVLPTTLTDLSEEWISEKVRRAPHKTQSIFFNLAEFICLLILGGHT